MIDADDRQAVEAGIGRAPETAGLAAKKKCIGTFGHFAISGSGARNHTDGIRADKDGTLVSCGQNAVMRIRKPLYF